MGRTIEELRALDTEKFDWFKCKRCGEFEFLPKRDFIYETMRRRKTCIDCRVLEDKEKNDLLTLKRREKKKAEAEERKAKNI